MIDFVYRRLVWICLVMMPCIGMAQQDSAISYSRVVKADSATKWQIYTKTLTWLGLNYEDFKFEVMVKDKEVAHLGGRGFCRSELDPKSLTLVFQSVSTYSFDFDIWILDGKYRYLFTNIYSDNFGLLTEKEKCPIKILFASEQKRNKYWLEEKKAFDREIQFIIASLTENLAPARAEYEHIPPDDGMKR